MERKQPQTGRPRSRSIDGMMDKGRRLYRARNKLGREQRERGLASLNSLTCSKAEHQRRSKVLTTTKFQQKHDYTVDSLTCSWLTCYSTQRYISKTCHIGRCIY